MSVVRLWVIGVSLALVALWAGTQWQRESPGPISATHAAVPELSGSGSCAHCHGGWFGDMTSACLHCHEDVSTQITDRSGLHGAVPAATAGQCALCHGEHHGEDFRPVNRSSFAQIGVPDPAAFDHQMIGFEMSGRHLELDCTKCHENANLPVLAAGQRRFQGLVQDCASCHDDPHEGRMTVSCASCHGQESFDQLSAPFHDRTLPLVGGHAGLDCAQCHDPESDRGLAVMGTRANLTPRTCASCHDVPHERDYLETLGRSVRVERERSCAGCHLPEHTDFLEAKAGMTLELHAFAFDLAGPHEGLDCSACHDPGTGGESTFAMRHPGGRANDCSKCHEDPHDGQFTLGSNPLGCIDCHERSGFETHTFDRDRHAAHLTLAGAHGELDCSACHVEPDTGAAQVFRGTASRCEGCHEDAHVGFFRERHAAVLAEHEKGECAACHVPVRFSPVLDFDHGRWTGFAIDGAHGEAGCESCHPRAETPGTSGRTLGFVFEHFGTYEGCASCHDDVHRGAFDKPGMPDAVRGRRDCARCHTTASFRDVDPKVFDHGKWTGFDLKGSHGSASCSACHLPLAAPTTLGRTTAHAVGRDCASCHEDPHRGQFEQAGRVDCARCHTGGGTWAELVFDHDRDSRFPLGAQHQKVACASCHLPVTSESDSWVKYRPMDRGCAACHGAQTDPLRRGRNGK